MKRICVFICTLLFFLLNTCAIRDNQYDPASPYYKAPQLLVALEYDTIKVHKSSPYLISAQAPFIVSIDAKANDFFNADDSRSVSLIHKIDGTKISEEYAFTNKIDTIKKEGNHVYIFSTTAENGAKEEKEYTISISLPQQPHIKSLRCSRDTLPLNSDIQVFIYADIIDSGLVANHISYEYTQNSPFSLDLPTNDLSSIDTQHFTDSMVTNLNSKGLVEYTQQVIAYLYDDLGRSSACSTLVTYSRVIGKSPVIDSIYIHEQLPVIYAGRMIQFGVDAHDTDGTIDTIYWEFGDKDASFEKHPYHTFNKSGIYTIKLTITDNSKNITIDSLQIAVKEKLNIKPQFTQLTVENDSGPSPLNVTVLASAVDEDGEIQSLVFSFIHQSLDEKLTTQQFSTSSIKRQFTLTTPGTYILHAVATDNDGNSCPEIYRYIIVTNPDTLQ